MKSRETLAVTKAVSVFVLLCERTIAAELNYQQETTAAGTSYHPSSLLVFPPQHWQYVDEQQAHHHGCKNVSPPPLLSPRSESGLATFSWEMRQLDKYGKEASVGFSWLTDGGGESLPISPSPGRRVATNLRKILLQFRHPFGLAFQPEYENT